MIKIIVPNKKYNRKFPNLGEDLSNDELSDICERICGSRVFMKVLDNDWSTGRYIKLVDDDRTHFVGISNRTVDGRNSFVQSIATIFSAYTNYDSEKKYLHYYFLPINGNNLTPYLKFCYRLMKTIKFDFINEPLGFGCLTLSPYHTITQLIQDRNRLRSKNSANNSSFITDEGHEYRIYGKSFGANSKETALICFAISFIADKPVKLFQILDNNSESMSQNDKNAIAHLDRISIIEDTYIFDEISDITEDSDNIRSARFTYNLLQKYGDKKCILCGCPVPCLINGAHIWSVADIKKAPISLAEKKKHASDGNNGIWLCENHHKLFDAELLKINENGDVILLDSSQEALTYIRYVTTITHIESNDEMREYLKRRYAN